MTHVGTPTALPVALTSFVGRVDELAQLRELLDGHRLVTVTGSGGAGKTRLAIEAARRAADSYPDGVWFVDLSEITDPDLVVQAVVDATGTIESAGRTGLGAVTHHVGAARALLLIDNCEQVVGVTAPTVAGLLRVCSNLTVLATSREPLGVDGEITWRIPALSLPADAAVDGLDASDAVRLFIDRALATRPNFVVTNDNAPAVAQICARLDGIPLAIELAAARVRMLSARQIADGLDDRFRLLGAGPRTALPRQATLAASVDWSLALLSEPERCLLARLSVFRGSFDLDAVEEVCAGKPLGAATMLDLLDGLMQKSLVVLDDSGSVARYHLLETIRQYARARLAGEEPDWLADAHSRHYAKRIGPLGRTSAPAAIEEVERNYPNLRHALAHAVAVGDAETALRLAASLVPYWSERTAVSEGRRWLGSVLSLAGGDAKHRARAQWGDAELAAYGGDFLVMMDLAARASEMAAAAGDAATEALALALVANGTSQTGDPGEANAVVDRVLELLGQFDEPFASAYARGFLANTLANLGRLVEAKRLITDALALQRAHGVEADMAGIATKAFIEALLGELDAAISDAATARDLARETGAAYYEAFADLFIAIASSFSGQGAAALEALARARAVAERDGDIVAGVYVTAWGMIVTAIAGDVVATSTAADQVANLFPAMGLTRLAGTAHAARAEVLLATGEVGSAVASCTTAVEVLDGGPPGLKRTLGQFFVSTIAYLVAARVLRAAGEVARAHDYANAGVDIAMRQSAGSVIPALLDVLGGLLIDGGASAEGLRLLAAADAARERAGARVWSVAEADHIADIDAARTALGDVTFDQVWDEGRRLTVEDAIAYARRGRGKRGRPMAGWASLTPVERDVVDLVADGLTNDQVAEKLFVSRNTVRTHLRNVFAKLNVTSRTELASAALKHGPGR